MKKYIVQEFSKSEMKQMIDNFMGKSVLNYKTSLSENSPKVVISLKEENAEDNAVALLGLSFVQKKKDVENECISFYVDESGEFMSSIGLTDKRLTITKEGNVITSYIPYEFNDFYNEIEDLIPAIKEENGIANILLNNIKKYIG